MSGFVGSISNGPNQGIHEYLLNSDGTAQINKIISGQNMQVTSLVYLASKNLMAFHTKDDKVYIYDAINGTHVQIFDTRLNQHGHSLPEHGIIRTNKTEDDLFVLMAPNRIGVLTRVTKLGFDTLVGVVTMDGHNISSYKPFHYDKVLTLCETMMLLVH